MADIVRIDLTDVSDTLQGTFQTPFRLTSMADDTTLVLQAGWTEEIGGYLYRVEGGNVTPSGTVSSGNTYYVYITEDGDGTATATRSTTAPTYDATKGGYYNGTSKAVFSAYYDGTNFINKTRIGYLQGDRHLGDLSIANDLSVGNDLTVTGSITSTGISPDSISLRRDGDSLFIAGTSVGTDEDDLFSEASLYVGGGVSPSCSGVINDITNNRIYIVSKAVRTSDTSISFTGMYIPTTTTTVVIQVSPEVTATIRHLNSTSATVALAGTYVATSGGTDLVYFSITF